VSIAGGWRRTKDRGNPDQEPRTCGGRGYVDGRWSAKGVDLGPGGLAGRAHGEVDEVRVGSRAVPMLLAGWDVDDVAGLDEVLLLACGEDATTLRAVEDLRNVVRVEVRAGTGGEPHEPYLKSLRRDDRLDAHLADEVLRFGVGAGFGRVGYSHALSISLGGALVGRTTRPLLTGSITSSRTGRVVLLITNANDRRQRLRAIWRGIRVV
jgi:hypothetical protein